MPIIVDEVVISVEVTNQASGGSSTPAPALQDKQTLVAECVERVLEILRERRGALGMSERGTLERLTILAYTKPDYSGAIVNRFEAFVNPNELTLSYEVEYDSAQGAGRPTAA